MGILWQFSNQKLKNLKDPIVIAIISIFIKTKWSCDTFNYVNLSWQIFFHEITGKSKIWILFKKPLQCSIRRCWWSMYYSSGGLTQFNFYLPHQVPVPMTGMRYNSLLWMCTLNTLTWSDLNICFNTWSSFILLTFFSSLYTTITWTWLHYKGTIIFHLPWWDLIKI